MNRVVTILQEPRLEFRYGQALADPHDGLTAFGPWDADLSARPKRISLAVIGTPDGLRAFKSFSEALVAPIPQDTIRPSLWPLYPGFEAIFDAEWPTSPGWTSEIDPASLESAATQGDPNRRVYKVVDLYVQSLSAMANRDERFGVVICVVPHYVWANCRPMSRVGQPSSDPVSLEELRQRRNGQMDLFERWDPDTYEYSLDFRNQLKARAMAFDVPIQIVRESTLQIGEPTGRRQGTLTPFADRAWNLTTTAYYKAGGKPWRLKGARDGVCYVGLAYRKRDPSPTSRSACCAAQMFLDSGDGVVFLGETGAWYSPERRQFHLDAGAAARLMKGLLQTYREQLGKPLTEIFLHANSGFDAEEFDGFRAGCPEGTKVIAVRVRREYRGTVKMYRPGTRPVIRGTVWKLNDRSGFLFASGFVRELRTYPGGETPVPLRIDIQHGEADFTQVASDILALTKLNYNACRIGDGEPVTVRFSKKVGEILVSNPALKEAKPQFRFYI